MTITRHLEITTVDGATVAAVAMRPPDAMSGFVLAHGAGAGMHHAFMEAAAQGLAARRIASLRFQFPFMQAGKRRVDTAPIAHATVRAAVSRATSLWPELPLFAGGKSFGGRMTSQAQAIEPLPRVVGLIFLGFPLHPAAKPGLERAAHLASIDVPMRFIRGSNDALAEARQFDPMVSGLGPIASRYDIAQADHMFHMPKRSGRSDEDALDELLDAVAVWTQAWGIQPSMSSHEPRRFQRQGVKAVDA